MHKIILTDIDGVVLDWQSHFNDYLDQYYPGQQLFDPTVFAQGEETGKIIKEFNNTAWIGFLKPCSIFLFHFPLFLRVLFFFN